MIEENATTLALKTLSYVMKFLRRAQHNVSPSDVIAKSDGSPVTVYDLATQALIVSYLERESELGHFPICGEESTDVLSGSGMEGQSSRVIELVRSEMPSLEADAIFAAIDRGSARPEPCTQSTHWTCDPIDGTKRFVTGHHYSSCLGFVWKGQLVGGAIACPDFEDDRKSTLVGVVRGSGSFFVDPSNPAGERHSLRIPGDRSNPDVVRVARSVGSKRVGEKLEERIRKAGFRAEMVEIDNQCKYVALATDRVDLITHSGAPGESKSVWDFSPGVLLATEAGGIAVDADARAFDFDQGALLLQNRGLRAGRPDVVDAYEAAR